MRGEKSLEYYMGLPYTRKTEKVEDEREGVFWLAWIEELPGCKTDGRTQLEAVNNLHLTFDDYIEAMIEFESPIPEPEQIVVNEEDLVLYLAPAIPLDLDELSDSGTRTTKQAVEKLFEEITSGEEFTPDPNNRLITENNNPFKYTKMIATT